MRILQFPKFSESPISPIFGQIRLYIALKLAITDGFTCTLAPYRNVNAAPLIEEDGWLPDLGPTIPDLGLRPRSGIPHPPLFGVQHYFIDDR